MTLYFSFDQITDKKWRREGILKDTVSDNIKIKLDYK